MLYSKVVRDTQSGCACPAPCTVKDDSERASLCTLVAVNCIRTVYRLLLKQEPVIRTVSSHEGLTAILKVEDDVVLHPPENMAAIMNLSHFKDELTYTLVECRRNDTHAVLVGGFLYECFDTLVNDDGVTSLVLTRYSQSMACIKLKLPAENVYLVMDPHIRASHPDGPALLLSHDLAEVVHYIDDALHIDTHIDSPSSEADNTSVIIHAFHPCIPVQKFNETDFAVLSNDTLAPLYPSSCKALMTPSDTPTSDPDIIPDSQPSTSTSVQENMPGSWLWDSRVQSLDGGNDSMGDSSLQSPTLGWLTAALESMQSNIPADNDQTSTSLAFSWDNQLAIQLQEEELDRVQDLGLFETPPADDDVARPPGNGHEHARFLEEIVRRRTGTTLQTLELPPPATTSLECGICHEMHPSTDIVHLPDCNHPFCNDCLRDFIKSKISSGRYPIFCPECQIDRSRISKTQIDQGIVEQLKLEKTLMDRLNELQLIGHSVVLHCPRCNSGMSVDRERLRKETTIICPISACGQHWCKSCNKRLASSATKHRCKHVNIDRLMRRKGWKYCPGCQTPIQKESGCNHITCGAPGCNVHFCYKCRVLIIDTTNGGDVGTAVTDHYTACQLFEKRFKCTIQ